MASAKVQPFLNMTCSLIQGQVNDDNEKRGLLYTFMLWWSFKSRVRVENEKSVTNQSDFEPTNQKSARIRSDFDTLFQECCF